MFVYYALFVAFVWFLFASAVFVWSVDLEAWRWVAAGAGFSCSLFLVLALLSRVRE